MTAAGGGNGVSAAAGAERRSLLEHGLPGQRKNLRWLVPVAAAVAIAVVVAILLVVLGTGGATHHRKIVHHSSPKIAAAPPGVAPSSVTFAVINGTTVNQLAHHIGDRLARHGFKESTLATASNETLTTTSVGYLPGHRDDALAVAHTLKLAASAVRPAPQSSLGLVCPSATTCTADVIVVAGTDLAPKR